MKTVFHIALEPIEGRYSAQWLKCIKPQFEKYAGSDWEMIDVLGKNNPSTVTTGAFLDFAGTNVWKSTQIEQISNMFSRGLIQPGSVFLFTDAWNPGIINVRYMSDLLDIPVRIVSYWHAGSYDKWDTLGYKIKDRKWSLAAERSFFEASDVNLFATKYHADFFMKNCLQYNDQRIDFYESCARENPNPYTNKIVVSGQPHYEILKWFEDNPNPKEREDIIIFPHRLCVEKRPEIFSELQNRMGMQFRFLRTQDQCLSKEAYYRLLQRAKLVFSSAEHEMLGISQMEGVLAGCIPLMPNRLSYKEMYPSLFLYDSDWTKAGAINYVGLAQTIQHLMKEFDMSIIREDLTHIKSKLIANYLTCKPMWEALIGETNG